MSPVLHVIFPCSLALTASSNNVKRLRRRVRVRLDRLPSTILTNDAIKFGDVHDSSISKKSFISNGTTRVSPLSCKSGGCTNTGIGRMSD